MTLRGQVFESASTRGREAEIRLRDGRVVLTYDGEAGETLAELSRVSDRVAGTARRLVLSDGRVFVTEDNDGADTVLAALGRRPRSLMFYLERPGARLLVVCLGVFMAFGGFLAFGLPAAADLAARVVPSRVEQEIGRSSFDHLDNLALKPSALDAPDRERVKALFDRVAAAADLSSAPELHFRTSPALGANAFAFPGGPVVVTDALVALAPSDAALAGVLAHEIAHIEARHGLRRILRATGWTIVLTAALGDANTLLDELATFPIILITQGYSREFETEADGRAVTLMARLAYDPGNYAEMLTRLRDACGGNCGSGGWWASHPGFEDRIEALDRTR